MALAAEIDEARAEIRRVSPRYSSLVEPRTLGLAEIQKLLGEWRLGDADVKLQKEGGILYELRLTFMLLSERKNDKQRPCLHFVLFNFRSGLHDR